ncbi:hypothetical protein [Actinoplanes palleronii]|uniref:Chromosome partition protein Smc n=1 Tax=Actinoplanes palleronii TaxID=113570 RepID=A0ABQ4B528_9ACTN|nr:hypothetical protein [Actinoplanes palleronii]GIE65380.1 hypothetical protein Apa02nite_014880 [Actinoplanes palleronii]
MSPMCDCDHPMSQHKLGRGGCRALDCDCARFEAARSRAEFLEAAADAFLGQVFSEPPPVVSPADRLRAELAEVKRDLAALDADYGEVLGEGKALVVERDELRERFAEVERERDAWMKSSAETARKLTAERDGAADQWARARDEVERLTRLLTEARETIARLDKHEEIRARVIRERNAERTALQAEVERLGVLLDQAEQYARDLQDDGITATEAPVERLYAEITQHLCLTCGSRYRENHQHWCGALTPVRVRITFIEESHS